jgi:type IV pilus biogenesis protein CpaD/CtpE
VQIEKLQETIMRTVLLIVATAFLAGCASTPVSNLTKIYDRKYNTTTYVTKKAEGDFVGTSANAVSPERAKPSWYRYGHP